jgi:hypothetical protein
MINSPGKRLSQRFLTYHPFATYGGANNVNIFKTREGSAAETFGRPPAENPDVASLWRLGERAYGLLPTSSSIAEFDEEVREFDNFVEDTRVQIYQQIMDGLVRCATPSGGQADPEWIKELPASAIVNICWGMGISRGPIHDDSVTEMFQVSFCIACLLEIDNANVGLFLDGRDAVASSLAAAEAFANAEAIATRFDQLQDVRRQMAMQGALSRVRNDPRQAEKQFIKECWNEWRLDGSRYASKAAFARDMLAKCTHLQNAKKIEDWTRLWEQEAGK